MGRESLPRWDLYVVDPLGSDAVSNSEWCAFEHISCLSSCRAAAQPAAALSRPRLATAEDGSGRSFQFDARAAAAIGPFIRGGHCSCSEFGSSFARAALPRSL